MSPTSTPSIPGRDASPIRALGRRAHGEENASIALTYAALMTTVFVALKEFTVREGLLGMALVAFVWAALRIVESVRRGGRQVS